MASSRASGGRCEYVFLEKGSQPVGHHHAAPVALDVTPVLIAVAERAETANRGLLKLGFCTVVGHFQPV